MAVTLVCLAGHENPVCNEFCTTCGVKLPPPLGPELFKRLSILPDPVQIAVFSWFVNDLHVDDACLLFDWFNYEAFDERDPRLVH